MAYVLWRVFMKRYSKVRLGLRNLPVSVTHLVRNFASYTFSLVYARACSCSQCKCSVQAKSPFGMSFHRQHWGDKRMFHRNSQGQNFTGEFSCASRQITAVIAVAIEYVMQRADRKPYLV